MTKDEALTMALESLENIYFGYEPSPRAQYAAITAIKEYFAQEQWTPADMAYRPGGLVQEQDHFADTGKPMQPLTDAQIGITPFQVNDAREEFDKAVAYADAIRARGNT